MPFFSGCLKHSYTTATTRRSSFVERKSSRKNNAINFDPQNTRRDFIRQLTAPVGKMKRILCSDSLPKIGLIVRSEFPALIPCKEEHCMQRRTKRIRNFWTMSAMESQMRHEKSKNKDNQENINEFGVFKNKIQKTE